jgi:hypothetical protein
VLPLGGERGEDTAASSRGRLAGESLWVPSGLLPGPAVTWHAVDDTRARVDRPQRVPYGFRVLAERTFGGFTIASQVKGGWWYGTDRYRSDQASMFTVTGAACA